MARTAAAAKRGPPGGRTALSLPCCRQTSTPSGRFQTARPRSLTPLQPPRPSRGALALRGTGGRRGQGGRTLVDRADLRRAASGAVPRRAALLPDAPRYAPDDIRHLARAVATVRRRFRPTGMFATSRPSCRLGRMRAPAPRGTRRWSALEARANGEAVADAGSAGPRARRAPPAAARHRHDPPPRVRRSRGGEPLTAAGRLTIDRRGVEARSARPCAFEPAHPEGSCTLTTRSTAGFSRRQVMRFGLFAAAGALLAACGQAAAPTEAPKASDTSAPKPTEAPKPA